MSSAQKLFALLLGRQPTLAVETPDSLPAPSVGLQLLLDHEGRVHQLTGPLCHVLAQLACTTPAPHLVDYLLPHSTLVVESSPADWQGQSLDLDFLSLSGQTLHLRGWVQPMADGWSLQLLDIGDLLQERQQSRNREQCQVVAGQMSEHLRLCSMTRLPEVLGEQLQELAQRWRIPCIALALLDEQKQGWQIHSQYTAHDAPALWHAGQKLGACLDSLNGHARCT